MTTVTTYALPPQTYSAPAPHVAPQIYTPAAAPEPEPQRTYAPAPAYSPQETQAAAPSLDWSFPELHPSPAASAEPAQEQISGPRVELTFRDGSSASLDATQARALDEIAQVLTRRD